MNLFRTLIRVEFSGETHVKGFYLKQVFSDRLSPFPTNRIEKIWAMSS